MNFNFRNLNPKLEFKFKILIITFVNWPFGTVRQNFYFYFADTVWVGGSRKRSFDPKMCSPPPTTPDYSYHATHYIHKAGFQGQLQL
jgi:hypothetical protein